MALFRFYLVFCNTHLALWSLVSRIPPPALLSCPVPEKISISFLTDNVCLNFANCLVNVCGSAVLTAL
jgi:hypothetical protein